MTKQDYYKSLSKESLITIINNLEYQLDLAEDKVEFYTTCRHFGEIDGMNGSCVDCYYNDNATFERCEKFHFKSNFWKWHCKKSEERQQIETTKNYKTIMF